MCLWYVEQGIFKPTQCQILRVSPPRRGPLHSCERKAIGKNKGPLTIERPPVSSVVAKLPIALSADRSKLILRVSAKKCHAK